jgi:hypothetical protein
MGADAGPAVVVAALLWGTLALYGASVGWWWLETAVFARGRETVDPEWGVDEIQVRILTVDAAAVVRATVAAVPDGLADVRVVSETAMDVDGATVHVVPDDFECEATNKGRAVEWARREIPCDREYVLYLDEDTLMTAFEGLPDADVIQFTEKPLFTGSRIAYLCEIFRVGYQYEQFGFHRLRYPLYAWGGGIAVRASLEDRVGWDVATITEDTNFVWRAAAATGLDFRVLDLRFRNQAPPSVGATLRQRRRWISGTLRDGPLLPPRYRPLYYTRIVAWAFSPFVPVFAVAGHLVPFAVPTLATYRTLSLALAAMLLVYTLAGLIGYRKHPAVWPVVLLLTPLAVVAHSIGALWGLVRPVRTFAVTEKVAPETVERIHDRLDDGDLTAHDGTGRLLRDDESGFRFVVFDD